MARGYRFGVVGSLSTVPNGKTVLPTDDIQIWLKCASIKDKTYTTLSQVLSDSTTLQALISSNNAVDYMVRSTTWASGVTADSGAMTLIGANNYASDTLLGNSTWLNAICTSPYFESVLNVKVPKMTDNTHPSGECSATGSYSSATSPYRAFDRDTTTYWASSTNSMETVYYQFAESMKLCCFEYRGYSANNTANSVSIVDSNNVEKFTTTLENNNTVQRKVLSSIFTDSKFGLKINSMYSVPNSSAVEVQFYGRRDV